LPHQKVVQEPGVLNEKIIEQLNVGTEKVDNDIELVTGAVTIKMFESVLENKVSVSLQ
jgi:hypothetical protein